jgi:glycosyltransferase involved in cell wall biosynthesis
MISKKLKIAIVCDWLTNFGGAEKVILALHQLFPQAPIYTSVYNKEKMHGFENAEIHTSHLQNFPLAKTKHQMYLPFYPQVFEQFNLNDYDIVISSSHSCAKGIITKPETLHICYCHSPMRYAWEDSINYIDQYEINPLIKRIAKSFIHKLRIWDRLSAERVDSFIANSSTVQKRIFKYYRKSSTIIHPFVDISKFKLNNKRKDYFLAVGRLIPYKRFDLIIEAFNRLQLPLIIAGTGVASAKLKQMAGGNIKFTGFINNDDLCKLYSEARALIFPQIEDFGITPLEAMATGCPVIAYNQGGARETVIDRKTGVFFDEQTPESLAGAVNIFKKNIFNPEEIRKHAESFDVEVFNKKIIDFVGKKWEHWQKEMINQ